MKNKIIISITILLMSIISYGQTKTHFPNLTRVCIDTTYGVFFNYDKLTINLINKPCYLINKKDPLYCNIDSTIYTSVIVGKFKNNILKDSLVISYSPGLSADPSFIITTKEGKLFTNFSCLDFYINASGTIYTAGHVNNMYNRRRKYQIQVDTVKEVIQPFNYVGLKGKTLKDITLYKDKTGNDIIAQLPKNYEIEILLADPLTKDFDMDQLFLVKTDFGLIGWLRLEGIAEPVIDGLYYAGD